MVRQQVRGPANNHSPSTEPLTDRERQVLQLLSGWKSTRQIAAQLNLSVKTIEGHLANMKIKLNLKKKWDLLHYATTRRQRLAIPKRTSALRLLDEDSAIPSCIRSVRGGYCQRLHR